jgi:hypothetical protein
MIIPNIDGSKDIQYIMIRHSSQKDCNDIIDMYNLCIDTDYLLYPNSNYKRCFSIGNDIYSCNEKKIEKNLYSQRMVSK